MTTDTQASEKQLRFLRKLQTEQGEDLSPNSIGATEASKRIDELLDKSSPPATASQLRFIERLRREAGTDAFMPGGAFPERIDPNLTTREASRLIDQLQEAARKPVERDDSDDHNLPEDDERSLAAPKATPPAPSTQTVIIEDHMEAGFRVKYVPRGVEVSIVTYDGREKQGERTITGPHVAK